MRAALALAALVVAAAWPARAPQAAPEPKYVVEPCCDLCTRANSPAAYNTKFLESFSTLTQGTDGWLFRSDDLRTAFGPDADGYRELKRLRDAFKRRGTDLVVVYQPTRGMLHKDKLSKSMQKTYNVEAAKQSYAATLERFRKSGLVTPDLTQLVNQPADQPYFFRGDHHWTPFGSQRTARIVADTILQLPSYKNMKRAQFTTERTGILMKKGTLYKAAMLICGPGYAEQYIDRYTTSGAGSEADLFGETEVPPITLLGTSNSDSAYNFAGFLSEYLGVDILNASIAGGRHDGALLQYLPSEEFQKNPPKIVVWEFETNHNLSQRMFYRQVVPLVGNGCLSKRPILSNKVELKGQRNEVLFNGGKGKVLPLVGKQHLIDLQISDPAVREIEAVVWYTNGSKETVDLKYSPYVEGRGRFVFELRTDLDWGERTFMSLDLRQPVSLKNAVNVSAQLCSRDDGPGQQEAAAAPPQQASR
ncbi:MAG TPA: alginate biosynthesis protein AlgX [Verrucomicrobiae bacterium]|nr:alginate biosynthesis protein AlgX [Verrucomicrobiae bacterium]